MNKREKERREETRCRAWLNSELMRWAAREEQDQANGAGVDADFIQYSLISFVRAAADLTPEQKERLKRLLHPGLYESELKDQPPTAVEAAPASESLPRST